MDTVWTLEVCTNYEGREVVAVYRSVVDALCVVGASDLEHSAGNRDEGWLAGEDGLCLTELRMDASPSLPDDLHRFERAKGSDVWREVRDPWWSGSASELAAMVAARVKEG